ncbi:MAG: M20/M25/M40 family metallo-hydrolase [Ignavibacteriaceae bacterium]|nr:M20/M25/M40 family metallo-hydrolase [Ignavibacteriaceae bacterium]
MKTKFQINAERLTEIFLETIKIDSLSGNEKPLANYICAFLSSYKDININEDNSYKYSNSNTGNLIIKVGNGGKVVMLSHMDTARPTKGVQPIVNTEKITSDGNTVLGVDNRVGVSVLLYTLEKHLSNGGGKNFTVAFTTCEETTLLGSKNIELDKKITKGFIFDSAFRPGSFINNACGAMSFEVEINGKASHSGISPEKGINSIKIASDAISNLQTGRIDDETTINFGKIVGGSAVNVVPEKTVIIGEVRSFDLDKIKTELEKIKKSFEKAANNFGGSIIFKSSWDFHPYQLNEFSDVYKTVVAVLTKAGLQPDAKISLGGSDANSLNGNGIPSVNLGIGAQNPHANDEFVLIEDLIKAAEIAHNLVEMEG